MSDESSVNLIISTFLAERRLFMDDIRTSNLSIRIIYGVYFRENIHKYTITRFLGNFGACANSRYQAFLPQGWPEVEANTPRTP